MKSLSFKHWKWNFGIRVVLGSHFSFSDRVCLLNSMTRTKTTSVQYVESRARDPTFEKFMEKYKELIKVVSIQDLILANQDLSIPVDFLSKIAPKLHLNKGAPYFLRKYPHVFSLFYCQSKKEPFCKLTDAAMNIVRAESNAIEVSKPVIIDRLQRLLMMSATGSLPLRAIFKVWRELGLPDDFEHSVISENPGIFTLVDAHEPNTHLLKLVTVNPNLLPEPTINQWRVAEYRNGVIDESEIRFGFKHSFPPRMKLSKEFRARLKEWQRLPYWGPYENIGTVELSKNRRQSRIGVKKLEKRAVGIVHEFLSLTVEKMVEVEKISQFRKWFRINLNIRDLFLDHPGIFYLSTKGKTHTIFLREAYDRDCLIDPNPVYTMRRKLLDLVLLGRRGGILTNQQSRQTGFSDQEKPQGENKDGKFQSQREGSGVL